MSNSPDMTDQAIDAAAGGAINRKYMGCSAVEIVTGDSPTSSPPPAGGQWLDPVLDDNPGASSTSGGSESEEDW